MLPPGAKLAVGITPVPEGHADSSYISKHRELLVEWNTWLQADVMLTDLPARLPDGLFASRTHLNGAGQKFLPGGWPKNSGGPDLSIKTEIQADYQIVQLTEALGNWAVPIWTKYYVANLMVLGAPLLCVQIWQHRSGDLLAPLTLPLWARSLFQGGLLYAVALFWNREASPFIYFQF